MLDELKMKANRPANRRHLPQYQEGTRTVFIAEGEYETRNTIKY